MAPLATFSTFSAPSLIFPPPSLSFSPRSLSIGMRVKTNSRFNLKLSVHRKNQEEIVVIDEDNLTDEAIFVFDTCLDWADTRKWKLGDTARAMARWFMRKDRIKLRELMEMTEQEFVEAILKRFR